MPTKFGLQIDFNLLKRAALPNPKPEVKFENCYDIITLPRVVRFG